MGAESRTLRRRAARSPTGWPKAELDDPSEDLDFADLSPAFPAWTRIYRDAVPQPPRLEIQPPERMLERAMSQGLDMEAAN